jgi:hypothetical protein
MVGLGLEVETATLIFTIIIIGMSIKTSLELTKKEKNG